MIAAHGQPGLGPVRRTARGAARVAFVVAAGCGGDADGAPGNPDNNQEERVAVAEPASRYLAHLMFVAPEGPAFLGVFDQSVSGGVLVTDYAAWTRLGGIWQQTLGVSDTLPTSRAAWRILPSQGLAVGVEGDGSMAALRTDAPGGGVRLTFLSRLGTWPSPTGQGEWLASASLEHAGEVFSGLAFFRRGAQQLDLPRSRSVARVFLLTAGEDRSIILYEGLGRAPSTGHAFFAGTETEAAEIELAGGPDRWTFSFPEIGLSGELQLDGQGRTGGTGGGPGLAALRGTVRVDADGADFAVRGLTAGLALP